MKIKVYYNKNLKMSDGKLAAQCSHAVAGLVASVGYTMNTTIVILEAREKKFFEIWDSIEKNKYMQVDLGFTEVEAGAKTAFAYVEEW